MTSRLRSIRIEHIAVFGAFAAGAALGSARISDNSTLVHLTTGVGILDSHQIPRADPYSFTAKGHVWVVQSWLPEVIYGLLYKLGGFHLFQLFNMLTYGGIAALAAWMARTGNWIRTAAVALIVLAMGASQWAPRPTAFGLAFMLLTVLVVTRKRNPLWLALIGILWINCHGSWPLGLAYVLALSIGARLDREPIRPFVRYFAVLAGAIVVGGLAGPSHWRSLTFPLTPFGAHAHAFSFISEWMSPNFRSTQLTDGILVLLAIVAALAIMFRQSLRWREIVPVAVFVAASLLGKRNLPMLGAVLIPALSRPLTTPPLFARPDGKRFYVRANGGVPGIVLIVVFCGLIGLTSVLTFRLPGSDLSTYPINAVTYLQSNNLVGGDKRVYAPDTVGCYLIFRYGQHANVFIDDRYDMYPASVENDTITINAVRSDIQPVLDKYKLDAVLLSRGSKLAVYLASSPNWQKSWSDQSWEIFQPRVAAR